MEWQSSASHKETIFDIVHSPKDASTFATCSYDGTVKLWDGVLNTCKDSLTGQEGRAQWQWLYDRTFTVTSTHSLQHTHFNPFTSTLSLQHMHFNSFTSTHSLQHIHFNTFTSTHSLQHPHFNTFASTHSLHPIHFNTFTSTHSLQHIHFNTCTSTHSLQHMHYNLRLCWHRRDFILPTFFKHIFSRFTL